MSAEIMIKTDMLVRHIITNWPDLMQLVENMDVMTDYFVSPSVERDGTGHIALYISDARDEHGPQGKGHILRYGCIFVAADEVSPAQLADGLIQSIRTQAARPIRVPS